MKISLTCFLLLLFGFYPVSAQCYKNLVFEGAGIRGVAYAGAMRGLEQKNMLEEIEKVGGTSAGAIAALMVSLDYSSAEIESLIFTTRLQQFNDGRFFFVGGMMRLGRHYGWYRGEAFARWLEKIIENKTGNAAITFRELHARNFKDLYVTGTSLNRQTLIIFSRETYPDMMIKDAVRISMSIPLYFAAVQIDSAGNVLQEKNISEATDIMVDGGIIGNFPIAMFNDSTIGFRIDTPSQIKQDRTQKGLAPTSIHNLKSYVQALYTITIESMNRGLLTKDDWDRTVAISSGDIGPKIRRLSVDEKNMLVENGYRATLEFLERSKQY